MTKQDGLKIGLALNHIAMSVDDATFQRIKGWLTDIEEIVKANIEEDGGEDE